MIAHQPISGCQTASKALVFVVRPAMQQSAVVTARSLMSVWCCWVQTWFYRQKDGYLLSYYVSRGLRLGCDPRVAEFED